MWGAGADLTARGLDEGKEFERAICHNPLELRIHRGSDNSLSTQSLLTNFFFAIVASGSLIWLVLFVHEVQGTMYLLCLRLSACLVLKIAPQRGEREKREGVQIPNGGTQNLSPSMYIYIQG